MFVDKQNEPRNDVWSYVRSPKVIKISIIFVWTYIYFARVVP